jgi:hypothetical protein
MRGIAQQNKKKAEQTATPSLYPQGFFHVKKCRHCGDLFEPKAPSELYCSDECKDYHIVDHYLRRNYHIDLDDYLDIAEQQGFVCAICHKDNFQMSTNHSGALVVDHDHETGEVRGLLCHNCNRALGLFQESVENLESAKAYLERVTTIPEGSTRKCVEAEGMCSCT